ncbi:hypothetical protein RRG08_040579 [Elysia crispata]|uniref:Uncharacterized protein n=1 Tax=Elysia crispata TaxID=231223 RepID=A0AAE0Z822_9GAST|nr:hypothetical protein RRG08_040579 [Elysia crispata]
MHVVWIVLGDRKPGNTPTTQHSVKRPRSRSVHSGVTKGYQSGYREAEMGKCYFESGLGSCVKSTLYRAVCSPEEGPNTLPIKLGLKRH